MQKSGHMVLKGVNWLHIDKMKKSGYMVSKETIRYILKMPGHIVLEGVNLVQNAKIR